MSAPFDRIIIRTSSLPGWPDCPRRSAARLFRKIIQDFGYRLRETPRGIAAAIGSAVHKSAAVILDEKARSGELPPVSVAEDCAVDSVKDQIASGVEFEGPKGTTQNRNDALEQAVGMARTYRFAIAPEVNPILVEERLECEVAPGIILSGQPDLVAREPGQIRDLKTGTRLGSYQAQVGGYSLLARTPRPEHPEGIDIERASIDFIQRVRAGKPQPDPLVQPVPLAEAETAAISIIRHITEELRIFRNGDDQFKFAPGDPWAFPANPSSVLCNTKWCPAYGSSFCREWAVKEAK